jgi:hypothetical protein
VLWIGLFAAIGCGGGGDTPIANETSCADGEDEDEDGAVDCEDADCTPDLACVEDCVDLLDNNANGRTDCEDELCWDDPPCFQLDDPTDLPEPDGDPSADLDKIGVSVAGDTGTLFATTDGTWPPPAGTYSYFITFELDASNGAPIAAVTLQHHAGVDSTIPLGIPEANLVIRQVRAGVWIRMTGVPAVPAQFFVNAGIQKTSTTMRVVDAIGPGPQPLP